VVPSLGLIDGVIANNGKQRRPLFRLAEINATDAERVDFVDAFHAFVRTIFH
jgi:hypothetical protein